MTVIPIGDAELYRLPSGVEVVYRDRDHSYWRAATLQRDGTSKCSGRLTGVSTVVSPYDWRPDFLMKWAAGINAEGVAALAAEGLSLDSPDDMRAALAFLSSGESITGALADAKLSYEDTRDDAARRGTNVHKYALQALAQGVAVPQRVNMTDEEWGYAQGVMGFWLEHHPTVLACEQVVADLDLGVAGRLDLLCRMPEFGDAVSVIDAKTSGFIPNKHHVQIAGYAHCAKVCGLVDEEPGGFILQVTPDGDFDLIPVAATADSLKRAIGVYRDAAVIGNAARNHAKRREAMAA